MPETPRYKKRIVELFNTLHDTARPEQRAKIKKITDLYKDRTIKNYKTAYNAILKLASHNKNVLKGAESMYNKIIESKAPEPEPAPPRRRITGKQPRDAARIKFNVVERDLADVTRAKSFATIHVQTSQDTKDEDGNETVEFGEVVRKVEPLMINTITKALSIKKSMKISMRFTLQVTEQKVNADGEVTNRTQHHTIRTRSQAVLQSNIKDVVIERLNNILMQMDQLNERLGGSQWRIKKYEKFDVDMDKTRPPRASSYIEVPAKFKNSQCGLINIKNPEDNECFKWCMLYHLTKRAKHDDRLSVLKKVQDIYNWEGVNFPATYDDIAHFEELNKVCIFVFSLTKDLVIVKDKDGNGRYLDNRVTLLRLENNEGNSHYVYIKHIDRLMHTHHRVEDTGKMMCLYCQQKIPAENYNEHIHQCYKLAQDTGALLQLPNEGSYMSFKSHKNKLFRPFIVHADFEATLEKTQDDEKVAKHVPNSVGVAFVCSFDPSRNFYRKFSGEGFLVEFLSFLKDLAEDCISEMQKNERMVMTKADWKAFNNAEVCHICEKPFGEEEEKVRDHDHRTGQFRGAAHNCCNINYYSNRYLPIVMHNFKNYDSHFIIRTAHQISKELGERLNFSGIPINQEKFMSLTVGPLRFIDSFQFMPSSLEKLAENLMEKGSDKFKHFNNMKREFPDHMEMLCKKGHYPYEWVDHESKFDHVGLPPIQNFYSELKQEGISEEDYKHAEHVYRTMNCQNFRDYHDIYLKTDVLLLADIFERFREVCHDYYGLDPANYFSAPGLAWDAMLLKTGIELQLITDTPMLDMVERQKRGGLCYVGSRRHAVANNPYVENYDPEKPSEYLMYWDANNLYGWAMSQSLPYDGLRFNESITLEEILKTPDDGDEGHIVEVDLTFPPEIHDKLKEYPPAPENLSPKIEWFSEFQKELGKKTGHIKENNTYSSTSKLIPHLSEHKNYVIHYRNLKFLAELGVEVTKLHKTMSFKQKPWLKQYIDFNTQKRTLAKNEFEKDFFKLMNNAVFGKTMENVKNRVDLRIATTEERAIRHFTKPTYKNSEYFNGLYMIEHFKKKIVYDKPIYVGTSILDLSKVCMMDFHYNVIQKNFHGNYNLLYSDTDSLVYSIRCPDIYDWMNKNRHHFDLSETVRPEMLDTTNKKVIGKMKDEANGHIITEFTALNPKVYSFKHQTYDQSMNIKIKNKKTCKGVSKVVVKNEINHDDYVSVLTTGETINRTVTGFRSYNHEIFTVRTSKSALTAFYDKQVMVDELHCLPFGYCQPPER